LERNCRISAPDDESSEFLTRLAGGVCATINHARR